MKDIRKHLNEFTEVEGLAHWCVNRAYEKREVKPDPEYIEKCNKNIIYCIKKCYKYGIPSYIIHAVIKYGSSISDYHTKYTYQVVNELL